VGSAERVAPPLVDGQVFYRYKVSEPHIWYLKTYPLIDIFRYTYYVDMPWKNVFPEDHPHGVGWTNEFRVDILGRREDGTLHWGYTARVDAARWHPETNTQGLHRTWEAAHGALLKQVQEQVKQAQDKLDEMRAALERAKTSVPPKELP
jgi:hypothetical protein